MSDAPKEAAARRRSAMELLSSVSPVRVVFRAGALGELLAAVREDCGGGRALLVTDPGIVAAGHAARAERLLRDAGVRVTTFDGTRENPTTAHVAAGLAVARAVEIDCVVALGGGSAMDCAKGINLLLTNGGRMQDYWGVDKTTRPLLPSVLVPTTAGTGSEAQSFALISDADTHSKMACGDRRLPHEGGLRPRVALLDPELTRTGPRAVVAAAGIDALTHAIETAATTARTEISRQLSRAAWELLAPAFERALSDPNDDDARADMLLGAHVAGAAIEQSMLGAAHACANPLTTRFGIVHGVAVGVMLPHVIRFNAEGRENPYADLAPDAETLAVRFESQLAAAGSAARLRDCGVTTDSLPELAESAATQWTATFNPRRVAAAELLRLYQQAR